ncbi:MAG: HEAT repeat domain-containing protein [Elusimicrobiota bacterium]|jgi:HEAT repeat protein
MPEEDRSGLTIDELIGEAMARSDDWAIPELKRRRGEALPGLIDLLNDKTFPKRWWVAHALGLMGDPAVVPPLLAALAEDSEISPWAVWALADLRDPRAVAPLTAALASKSVETRERAAQALAVFGNSGSVEPLCGLLLRDPSWYVRCKAADALAMLKAAAAVPALTKALETDMEDWENVVDSAASALADIDAPLSLKPLVAALGRPRLQGSHDSLVFSIARLCRHDQASVVAGLESPSEEVRWGAAEALAASGDAAAVPPLLEHLKDPSRHVRGAARDTLKAIAKRGVKVELPRRSFQEAARDAACFLMGNYFIAPGTEGFSAYRTGIFVHILFSISVCMGALILATEVLFRSPAFGASAGGVAVFLLWGAGVWLGVLSHYNPLITLAAIVGTVLLSKTAGGTVGLGALAGIVGHAVSFGLVRLLHLARSRCCGE